MMYDLGERGVDGEELLEESSFNVLKPSAEEPIEELTDDSFTGLDIVLKAKELYEFDDILQRII